MKIRRVGLGEMMKEKVIDTETWKRHVNKLNTECNVVIVLGERDIEDGLKRSVVSHI